MVYVLSITLLKIFKKYISAIIDNSSYKSKKELHLSAVLNLVDGNFLSSHTVSHAILSAFVSLTFVFDMGTSGSSQLSSPPWLIVLKYNHNYIFLSASYFAFRTKPW